MTVVRKEYAEEHPDVVAAFLTDYAKSVEAANTDLDGTAALCEEQGVVAKAAIAKKALPECNIVCLTGDELKTFLNQTFSPAAVRLVRTAAFLFAQNACIPAFVLPAQI